ncbi:hypothetical protein J437_LFUL017885 [Ladona fulva]|uniref:Uncharacterized protein n=1 Tax=Ladona fulva TaxID=123851 RepID=A0A8K0K6W2_LADFU|nr:hypothetical protein J437_LFUL017885 [Ladona fulva]
MPIYLKTKVYKLIVHPVALYRPECWPTTTKQEQVLFTMEMKILRWHLGRRQLNQVMNEDIRKLFGVALIMYRMQESRFQWYGHVPVAMRLRLRNSTKMTQVTSNSTFLVFLMACCHKEDALDRKKWRKACKTVDPASSWT